MKIDIEAMMKESYEARAHVRYPEAVDLTEEVDDGPLSYEELERKFASQWLAGAKLEAIETVMGRPIGASDAANDPNLRDVVLLQDADQALGALLMIKEIESSSTS